MSEAVDFAPAGGRTSQILDLKSLVAIRWDGGVDQGKCLKMQAF
jgi:hypothetical protein